MSPVFSIDWSARLAEETSQWANAHQLEAVMAEVFADLCPVSLDSFGEDEGETARFVAPEIACVGAL